jgi:hypothetical protein
MHNPFPKITFVLTPDSLDDLSRYCASMSGSEKVIATLIFSMSMNLAHKMFEEAKQEKE